MDAEAIVKEFKVVLAGDGGVGKTTYLGRYRVTQDSKYGYGCLRVYQSRTVILFTSQGPVKILLIDTSGQQKLGGLRQAYYLNTDAVILMFDVTSRITYKNIANWYKDIRRVREDSPIVVVGNKLDVEDRKVKPKQIKFPRRKNLPYCEISAKANYNWQLPLIQLLRKLMNDEQLKLVDPPTLHLPLAEIGPNLMQKLRTDWEEVKLLEVSEQEDQF